MNPADGNIRITPTHASERFEGRVWGVATSSFGWLAATLGLGAIAFVLLSRRIPIIYAAGWAFLPSAAVVFLLRYSQLARPPGHATDILDSMVTGGAASPPTASGRSRVPLFPGLPDATVIDGLLLGEGANGPWVAKGWFIETPYLQTASAARLNEAQDAWVAVLRQIPLTDTLQVLAGSSTADGARLLTYRDQTAEATNPVTRHLRNLIFLHHWKRMEGGQLRQRQTAIFLIRPMQAAARSVDAIVGTPKSAEIADSIRHFIEWELTLRRSLEPIGTRIVAVSDADAIRLWAARLNPSLGALITSDPAKDFDPNLSLLENLWHSDLKPNPRHGFWLDGHCHAAFSLQRVPGETYPSLIQALTYLPFGGTCIATHIRRLDKEPILRRAQASVERIHRQVQGGPNERMSFTSTQLEERIRRLSEGEAVPLEMELSVVLRARTDDDMAAMSAALKSATLTMNGARMYEATLPASARNLFAATLPGCPGSRGSGYVHGLEDRPVADLLPLASSFAGHPGPVEALFHGADGNLVNVVSFLGEGSAATPQNLLILGAPGLGKSVALNKLLHETDSQFGFTAIIDFGGSQASYPRSHHVEPVAFDLAGGQIINLFDTHGFPITPFAVATQVAVVHRMIGLPRDEDAARRQAALLDQEIQMLQAEKARDVFRWWPQAKREEVLRQCAFLIRMVREERCPLLDAFVALEELRRSNPAEAARCLRALPDEELREVEVRHARDLHALIFAHLAPEQHLRLSSLREHLELSDDEARRWLAVLLSPWTEGGAYGRLFDGAQNVPLHGSVQYFELGQLPKAAKEVTDVAGFLLINSLHYSCLTLPRNLRKRIVIEEISRFLEMAGAEAMLRELAESFRKYHVQLVLTGQTYSRIADTPVRAAILGNVRALFIFNTGDRKDVERLANDLGLSTLAREAILRLPRPDQLVGERYSEFLYYHTDPRQPICGVARHYIFDLTEPSPRPTSQPQPRTL